MAKPIIHLFHKVAPKELQEDTWKVCMAKNWYFGNNSGNKEMVSFWKMDLDNNETIDRLWTQAKPHCEKVVNKNLEVIRQYANGHTYGLGGQAHQDDLEEGTYTLLYYPMPVWKNNWEGETLYFDQNGEVIAAIKPMPNRAVLFDSRIPHVGRAPSRYFGGLRVTVAYKLNAV